MNFKNVNLKKIDVRHLGEFFCSDKKSRTKHKFRGRNCCKLKEEFGKKNRCKI